MTIRTMIRMTMLMVLKQSLVKNKQAALTTYYGKATGQSASNGSEGSPADVSVMALKQVLDLPRPAICALGPLIAHLEVRTYVCTYGGGRWHSSIYISIQVALYHNQCKAASNILVFHNGTHRQHLDFPHMPPLTKSDFTLPFSYPICLLVEIRSRPSLGCPGSF